MANGYKNVQWWPENEGPSREKSIQAVENLAETGRPRLGVRSQRPDFGPARNGARDTGASCHCRRKRRAWGSSQRARIDSIYRRQNPLLPMAEISLRKDLGTLAGAHPGRLVGQGAGAELKAAWPNDPESESFSAETSLPQLTSSKRLHSWRISRKPIFRTIQFLRAWNR